MKIGYVAYNLDHYRMYFSARGIVSRPDDRKIWATFEKAKAACGDGEVVFGVKFDEWEFDEFERQTQEDDSLKISHVFRKMFYLKEENYNLEGQTKTQILSREAIAQGASEGRVWLKMYRTIYSKEGRFYDWFHASRQLEFGTQNDAVVICVLVKTESGIKILMVNEARIPLAEGLGNLTENARCWDFPAGLIELNDEFENRIAAEVHEETGLTVTKVYSELTSQPYLLSSAGLSNESCSVAFVEAEGELSDEHLEGAEDIRAHLFSFEEAMALMKTPGINFSAKAWMMLLAFKMAGKFTFEPLLS